VKQTLPLGVNVIGHVHIYNTLLVLLAAYFTFIVFNSIGCSLHFLGLSATFWMSSHSIDRDRVKKNVEHGGCCKTYEQQQGWATVSDILVGGTGVKWRLWIGVFEKI
jgi:hypothetical protein